MANKEITTKYNLNYLPEKHDTDLQCWTGNAWVRIWLAGGSVMRPETLTCWTMWWWADGDVLANTILALAPSAPWRFERFEKSLFTITKFQVDNSKPISTHSSEMLKFLFLTKFVEVFFCWLTVWKEKTAWPRPKSTLSNKSNYKQNLLHKKILLLWNELWLEG